jgi:CysZ protein
LAPYLFWEDFDVAEAAKEREGQKRSCSGGIARGRHCPVCGRLLDGPGVCRRCDEQADLADSFTTPDRRKGLIVNFFLGLRYYAAGFSFLNEHRRLYRYIAIPLLINLLLFAGIVALCLHFQESMLGFIDRDWDSGFMQWVMNALYWLCYALLLLLNILLSLILTMLLSMIVNSPFYEVLSEKVENIYLGGDFDEPWSFHYVVNNILVPLKESIKLVLFESFVMALLFGFSLFTGGIGSVIFGLAGVWFAALSFFDITMARKGYSLAEKRRFMGANPGFTLGFGTPAYFIPFIAPFAVVGATLGFLKSMAK